MLVRNTAFNLLGLGLPLIVAVITIPLLIEALGTSQFGMLTLIWAVVSYFGLFDLGLGRTLTLQMAVAESSGTNGTVGPAVATALIVMLVLGVAIGLLMALGADWGIALLAEVPQREQAVAAVVAMGVAIPAITLTSGFRGILEARHAFGIVNLIRLPMGIYTFLGPLVAVWLAGPQLDVIAWTLVAGRYLGLAAHAWFAIRYLPDGHGGLHFRFSLIRPLLSIGGWLTVGNIISPFMAYADRFIIGALISAAAVAYYATPYEIVTKLWIVPGALTSVLFPTFAAQMARENGMSEGIALFRQSVAILGLVMLPVCAGLAIFSTEILSFWIDHEFAENSANVLSIFAVGMWINCMAHIPFTLIQSAGKPKWTAMIHMAEVVPFLVVLWWATSQFGAVGAATAWLVRIVVDTILMFAASRYAAAVQIRRLLIEGMPVAILAGLAVLLFGLDDFVTRLVCFFALSLICGVLLLRQPAIAGQIGRLFAGIRLMRRS